MNSSIFFGGSAVAAFVAGMIALFAPCCISVMLPAYFANSFRNRGVLVGMTLLFAAGIATVILPLAMGASVLRQIFVTQHTLVYTTAGLLMLAMGLYTLGGGQMHLPMPGRRAGSRTGVLSVYSLGIFSGVASSCCAPVLAGVIALSSVAQSFTVALGLGVAYVFGMVAPLFFVSVLWDRFDWRSSWLFRQRQFTWRIGSFSRTISGSSLASGLLLAVMGVATVWVGLAYDLDAGDERLAGESKLLAPATRPSHHGLVFLAAELGCDPRPARLSRPARVAGARAVERFIRERRTSS
ncbi:cytochrome c biogenesis CcdA family protein (plasmid) [Mesorhizobium atlanticum]